MEFPKNVSSLKDISYLRITSDIPFLQIKTRINAIKTTLIINTRIKIKVEMFAKK